MAFVLTRINVGDYDAWKPLFDQDAPGARRAAKGYRIFRNTEDPGEVFVLVSATYDADPTPSFAGVPVCRVRHPRSGGCFGGSFWRSQPEIGEPLPIFSEPSSP